MNDDAIVFAMANPTPEVMPEDAEPHVRIMATGRSDYPNQINNVLCFPGIFRGALDAGAPRITEEMKLAAAQGIAAVVTDDDLDEDYIIPSVFNRDVAPAVAEAVVEEAQGRRDRPHQRGDRAPSRRSSELRVAARGGIRVAGGTMRVLVTGASGAIGRGGLRRAAGARRRGRRPVARPRDGARDATRRSSGTRGTRRSSGRRRRRSRASTGSSTSSASRSTSAGPTRRRSGSSRAARRRPATSSHAIVAADPRSRGCSSASRPSATTATRGDAIVDESAPARRPLRPPGLRRLGGRRARGRGHRRAAGDHPHRARARQGPRPAQGAAAPVQARRRRPARRRPLLHALDQPRRRGRPAALGARHRERRGRLQRDRARTRSPTRTSRRRSAGRSAGRR